MQSLQNHLLIARPGMPDPRFHDCVIYMCQHNMNGAFGLVINKPSPITYTQLAKSMSLPIPKEQQEKLYLGGPVETDSISCLHSQDYQVAHTQRCSKKIRLTSTREIVADITNGQGPKAWRLFAGLTIWGPGQLESEILGEGPYDQRVSWLYTRANPKIVFETEINDIWHKSVELVSQRTFANL